ncbi:lysozyme [Granulicella mallensis]|uniref:Lysozyme n=1 Tax=Granulicella mallensis (strain ATCC BAA-1857 / DSM 23137 / MP5ACTX8) TaxID=682795 RepID=G8NRA9_GRAMM|nr:lysozyme [Granulicella mallensis]AEU36187.1 Lysozyme [Granulicella mallensis MP5ACTX8]
MTYQFSPQGLSLTKQFEGLRLTAYQDVAGVWTIGYGHTGDVHPGQTITNEQADSLLLSDMAIAIACVNRLVKVPLTQGQFDALCDFTFNEGVGNFTTSTLLRVLNTGDYTAAAKQFSVWVYAGGKVQAGLERRRAAEQAMFSGSGE